MLLVAGCSAGPPAETIRPDSTLLRITTQPDSVQLCEGAQRRVAVGVSWTGSSSPGVSDLPKLTWHSNDQEIVAVDSTGQIMGLRAGDGHVVVLGTVGDAYGRAVLPVRVLSTSCSDRSQRERCPCGGDTAAGTQARAEALGS